MESLIIRICESLLFGNTKITLRIFLKKCKKQDVKIIRAVAERLVAFLQSLPKNLAVFQALEPAFEYIIHEQLEIPKEYQEYILRAEKLEFKKHITSYELAGAFYVFINYIHLFTEKFKEILKYDVYAFPKLHWFLGQMWLKHGDVKNVNFNINCHAYLEAIDRRLRNVNLVSPKTFKTFRGMALHLLSKYHSEIVEINYKSSYITFD